MARPKGSRNALIRIAYDDIGRLTGSLETRPASMHSVANSTLAT